MTKKRGFKVPFLGERELIDLAFMAGLGALVVVEVLEWPVALVLGVGKVLADQKHNRVLAVLGEGLDKA